MAEKNNHAEPIDLEDIEIVETDADACQLCGVPFFREEWREVIETAEGTGEAHYWCVFPEFEREENERIVLSIDPEDV